MTNTTTYMFWKLIESPIYMLCHRYSNLAYSYTTIDSASFSMSLWYYWNLTHYYNTMYTATLIIWYLCYNNQLSRLDPPISMVWHWYNYLAYYFRNKWFSKLLWSNDTPDKNLIHYYITSDTATLMIWYSLQKKTTILLHMTRYNTWYNNK